MIGGGRSELLDRVEQRDNPLLDRVDQRGNPNGRGGGNIRGIQQQSQGKNQKIPTGPSKSKNKQIMNKSANSGGGGLAKRLG